jgi:excisionase family DNA binding protein
MTGMCADRCPDNMKGLLEGLYDCSRYKQIILYPSQQFLLPPEHPKELIPLLEFDEDKPKAALLKHSDLLKAATILSLSLFFEALLSFAFGRQVVLICGGGNCLSRHLLSFFSTVEEKMLYARRVEVDKFPLLSGIKDWPVLFDRVDNPLSLQKLLPCSEFEITFPWGTKLSGADLMEHKHYLLCTSCPVKFIAEDALLNPRALLIEGKRKGFLLIIPKPSNMKNFSITLRTGKGFDTPAVPHAAPSAGKAPKVERNWLSRKEVSDQIGKSTDSVDNYCRDGKLSSYKVGREVRITKESVQQYLNQGTGVPGDRVGAII